jgi:hypothetical protein
VGSYSRLIFCCHLLVIFCNANKISRQVSVLRFLQLFAVDVSFSLISVNLFLFKADDDAMN